MTELFMLYIVMLREILGHTQTELARLLGVSQGCLSKLERGVQGPNGELIVRAYRLSPKLFEAILGDRRTERVLKETFQGQPMPVVRRAFRLLAKSQY